MQNKSILIAAVIALLLLSLAGGWFLSHESKVGGDCSYLKHAGECTITAVSKLTSTEIENNFYSITHDFVPAKLLDLRGIDWITADEILSKKYNYASSKDVLGLEGANFECELQLITKGTCTPLIIDYSNLESDNFEYLACGCGCCTGAEPEIKCLYHSKGDDLKNIIANDIKFSHSPACPLAGCSIPITYKYCD